MKNLKLLVLTTLFVLPFSLWAQSGRMVRAKFTWEIGNAESTDTLNLHLALPADIKGRQKVDTMIFSIPPDKDYISNGSRYVTYNLTAPIPREITIEANIALFKDGLSGRKLQGKSAIDPDAYKNYLGSTPAIQTDAPAIKALAQSLRGKTEEITVKNIMQYIANNITYKRSPQYKRQTNLETLEKKIGICGDFSDLMIALCRANGIPARTSGGYMIERDFLPGWDGDTWHVWVDVYMSNRGWVPFEPTRNSIKGWQTIEPRYVYIAQDLENSDIGPTTYKYNYNGWKPRVDSFFSVR